MCVCVRLCLPITNPKIGTGHFTLTHSLYACVPTPTLVVHEFSLRVLLWFL